MSSWEKKNGPGIPPEKMAMITDHKKHKFALPSIDILRNFF